MKGDERIRTAVCAPSTDSVYVRRTEWYCLGCKTWAPRGRVCPGCGNCSGCLRCPPAVKRTVLAEPNRGSRTGDLPNPLPGKTDRLGDDSNRNPGQQGFGNRLVSVLDRASNLARRKLDLIDVARLCRLIHVKSILPYVSSEARDA